MPQGSVVSTLPQMEQTVSRSFTLSSARRSGTIAVSRFFMRCSTARRAERGPRPGSRASAWVRVSISVVAVTVKQGTPTRLGKPISGDIAVDSTIALIDNPQLASHHTQPMYAAGPEAAVLFLTADNQ